MKPIEFDLALIAAYLNAEGGNTPDGLEPIDSLDDLEEFEEVEAGSWEQDYKYQHRADVYRHKPTGRYVCVNQSRSGSPFTDWDYGETHVCEVFEVTETITRTIYTTEKPV